MREHGKSPILMGGIRCGIKKKMEPIRLIHGKTLIASGIILIIMGMCLLAGYKITVIGITVIQVVRWLLMDGLMASTTPDGKQVGEDGTLVNDSPIGGKWYLGIDADLTGIYETGEVSKPDNMNREYDNSWWYLYYAGNNANSTGYVYAQGWIWIDEDKNGIKDGILNRYYFDGGWLATNTIIDGKKVNGDGMWIVDNEVQTISQRRDVEGNTKWRGLTPGIYWDAKHNSRIEISKDWGLHYFENNKNTPYMEAEILYGEADESFPEMIYTVQVLKDPIKENNNKGKLNSNQNYLSIFIDAGEDYSGRGYSSPGDITIICGYTYGIFNQTDDKGRDRHFYFESK